MKIFLDEGELEQAIKMYLEYTFEREVFINDSDGEMVDITLGSYKEPKEDIVDTTDEPENKTTRRRRRRTKSDNTDDSSEIETEEDRAMKKYSSQGRTNNLNKEEIAEYSQFLQLMNNNQGNKNKEQIQQLLDNMSDNLAEVIHNHWLYEEWVKLLAKEDNELDQAPKVEESNESEIKEESNEEEPIDNTQPIVTNSSTTPLFTKQEDINKSGSMLGTSATIDKQTHSVTTTKPFTPLFS